jgi:hypothetical protein
VELLRGSVGSGCWWGIEFTTGCPEGPLEPVLWRARGSARVTSAVAGSSSAKRESRRAQTVSGSNGQGGSPRTVNGGWRLGQRSNAREEKTSRLFIGKHKAVVVFPCAPRLWGRDIGRDTAGGGSGDVRPRRDQWRVAQRRPTCGDGTRGTGLVLARVTPTLPQYRLRMPRTVGQIGASACAHMAVGVGAPRRRRTRRRAHGRGLARCENHLALFDGCLLKISKQKWTKQLIGKL